MWGKITNGLIFDMRSFGWINQGLVRLEQKESAIQDGNEKCEIQECFPDICVWEQQEWNKTKEH